MDERILPIKITDKDTGVVYELDFNRESVLFAERQGFKVNEFGDFPNSDITNLFYYSFRAHHKNIALNQAKALLDKMGGLTQEIISRLLALYIQATESNNVIQEEEDLAKNSHVAVEL